MRRKTFDMVLTAGGGLLAVVLIAAGSLGMWGYSYANSNVHNQLGSPSRSSSRSSAAPHSPARRSARTSTSTRSATSRRSAGRSRADHFIAVHLQEIGGGKTYRSSQPLPPGPSRGQCRLHRSGGQGPDRVPGHDASGPAVEAYAFWTIGQVALWGAIISSPRRHRCWSSRSWTAAFARGS